MGMFDNFPYTNFHELNLEWILKMLKEIDTTMDQFVAINTLKYADPIQWDITTQYAKNTVVVDGNSGTAYLSVQPVPAGVLLANTDYWSEIFSLNIFGINQNVTFRNDGSNLLSTFESNEDDWLIWNNLLYKVTRYIGLNTAYVVGYNLDRFSVELFLKEYITDVTNLFNGIIGDLDDLNTTDKSSVVNAINDVLAHINTICGDLDDLNTTDKTSIVNAINDVLSHIDTICGDLNNLNTTDKTSIVDSINEVLSDVNSEAQARQDADGDLNNLTTTYKTNLVGAINEVNGNVGDLNNLSTSDKTSIVNAINEVLSDAGIRTVKDYGAVGDGITDDTTAIENCITNEDIVIFPSGDYVYAPDAAPVFTHKTFLGYNATILSSSGIKFNNCNVYGLSLDTVNGVLAAEKVTFDNCSFLCSRHATNVNNALDVTDGAYVFINNCLFDGDLKATMGIWADESGGTAKIIVQNSSFTKFYLNAIFSSAQEIIIDNCYFSDNHYQTSPTGGGQIDIGAKSGVKTNACVRNCQFWGGYTATCGIETAGSYGLFITIQDCTINSQNGTWCIALQDGTYANITGNFLYSNASYPNISLTGGSEAVSNGNYMIGTKYSDATKVKNYGEFT